MEKNKEILEELREVSPGLGGMEKRDVFTLPEGYFINLEQDIVAKINSGIEGKYYFEAPMPYKVPKGYFADITEAIIGKVRHSEVHDELQDIAPILNSINKNAAFSVPEGYFTSIRAEASAAKVKKSPVIRLRASLRYLAAAVVIGLLAIGAFLLSNKNESVFQAEKGINKQEIKLLSESEIVDYLGAGGNATDVSQSGFEASKKQNIQTSVKELADEEIKQYLVETGDQEEI